MAETAKELQKKEAQVPERVERTRARTVFSPQVDIVEKKEEIVVTADMPGVGMTRYRDFNGHRRNR